MYSPAHPFQNKRIVVCVAGGIAAYKAVEMVRLLTKQGATVNVAMTARAQNFVGALTFQALTGAPVFTDLFDLSQESQIGHIAVADAADLVLIAPSTGNLLARMAAGMADDVVTAIVLATKAPILSAPSMNVNMWQNSLTQANVARLRDIRGVQFVGPGDGFLACQWIGPGRLAEPSEIVEAAARMLTEQDLDKRHVVVSAGPTHEPLDPVRFISNRSTGKMGYALAQAAVRRGARVTLVSGPVSLDGPLGVERVSVDDARSMDVAIRGASRHADAVIMAAAVADFRPFKSAEQKLKKDELSARPTIELVRNPDILADLGTARRESGHRRPLLIGFAAETRNVIEYARSKLRRKHLDLIVANDVSQNDAGFGVDTNRVHLITQDRVDSLALAHKHEVAHRILDRLVSLFIEQASRGQESSHE